MSRERGVPAAPVQAAHYRCGGRVSQLWWARRPRRCDTRPPLASSRRAGVRLAGGTSSLCGQAPLHPLRLDVTFVHVCAFRDSAPACPVGQTCPRSGFGGFGLAGSSCGRAVRFSSASDSAFTAICCAKCRRLLDDTESSAADSQHYRRPQGASRLVLHREEVPRHPWRSTLPGTFLA